MTKYNCSVFKKYDSVQPIETVNIIDWVLSPRFKAVAEEIRSIRDKSKRDKRKAQLPCITPSGIFSQRNSMSLISHSGLICLDFDQKDNPHIDDWEKAKYQISLSPYSLYCGLSISGEGIFVLVRIAEPENHGLHFDSLRSYYASLRFIADIKCRDIARLRGASYDDDSYLNLNAKIYKEKFIPRQKKTNNLPYYHNDGVTGLVEKCINKINRQHISIADDYGDWLRVGCSLSSEFGESGRLYFNIISSKYQGRIKIDSNDQYDKCLKSCDKSTIGTFFYYCKLSGITFKD